MLQRIYLRNFFIVILFLVSLQASEEYTIGEGVQIAELPFYVGGYISLDYQSAEEEDRYRLNDIAILGYGNKDKFSYMAELEFKEFYVKKYSPDVDNTSHNTRLYIERLYLDYNINENYTFRVGKYNSPIGFWNLLPINVLRETTSSPISSSIIYPRFTTGLASSYSSYGSGEFKVDLMFQHNEDVDDEYNNYEINKHYAFGLTYEEDNYALKFNSGYFNRVDDDVVQDELYYMLLSAKYDDEKYQLLGELGKQESNKVTTSDYAGYIQGLYRMSERYIWILRLESYDDMVNDKNEELMLVGFTYRPIYPVAIKSEYQFHSHNELDQILFSLSVLF